MCDFQFVFLDVFLFHKADLLSLFEKEQLEGRILPLMFLCVLDRLALFGFKVADNELIVVFIQIEDGLIVYHRAAIRLQFQVR